MQKRLVSSIPPMKKIQKVMLKQSRKKVLKLGMKSKAMQFNLAMIWHKPSK